MCGGGGGLPQHAYFEDGGILNDFTTSQFQAHPWLGSTYSCAPPNAGTQSLAWAWQYSNNCPDNLHQGIGYGSTDSPNCNLSGWHVDYNEGATCYWGQSTPRTDLGCKIALSGTQINSTFQYKVLASHDYSIGSSWEDLYVDYWIHWTSPVGPCQFSDMEFMFRLASTVFPPSSGTWIAFGNCPGTGNYQYFQDIAGLNTGNWVTVNMDNNFWNNAINHALCGPGSCSWNIGRTGGYFTGVDFGVEAVNHAGISGIEDSFDMRIYCPATQANPYGCQGAIGNGGTAWN